MAVILLLLLVFFAIHLTVVQNWIVQKVSSTLSENLHTTVSVQHVDFSLFDKMDMEGLLVEDHNKDTLLYAGNAKVEITDWFFLKDKATIQYAALEDAVINMKRSDSVWNYQFLVDYFSSPNKDTTKKAGLQFDIKVLDFQNIQFNKIDNWNGKDVHISVKKLNLLAEDINFTKKQINLNDLNIDEPSYAEYFYPGKNNTPDDTTTDNNVTDTTQKENGFVINVKALHLNNASFSSITQGETPVAKEFDGSYINFYAITGDIKTLHYERDSLVADILLSAKERCGLEVKKISALMKFTSTEMEFNNLDLVLNRSRLRNYYVMRFHHFNNDMANFLHNVTLKATFQNSEVSSDDIGFFAPAVNRWKKIFTLKGEASGKVSDLVTKRMLITSGNSIVDGDIQLKGLPDINNTYIDFKANNLQTNFNDITAIVPSLKKITDPQLSKLTNIHFKGNFTGFIKDFVAFGTLNTNLGNVTADINLKFPDNKPAVYLGKISTDAFNLGSFINNDALGNISFDGKIDGKGFTTDEINTHLDGTIHQIECSGYNYQNIVLKGDFEKKFFNGTVSINDPNLKLDNLRGSIDFTNKQPQFNFDASLAHANLKELKLTKDNFVLSGHFRLDFKGSNIDNFSGTAKVYKASLLHDNNPLSFDSLTLHSELYDDDKKILTLESNEIDASINGRFKIMELPDAFKIFLSRYYPSYIQKPSYNVSDEDFSFNIDTKDIDNYIQLVDPKLNGFNSTNIHGNLDLKNNALNINAVVPEFSYDGKIFNNIRLESTGNYDTLKTTIDADDVTINDSLHLPSSKLVFASNNDISDLSVQTSASTTLNAASLNARIQTMSDGVSIHFFPSSFLINDKKWELEKDGSLTITKSQVTADNIKFTQDYQQLIISTKPSALYSTNDLMLDMTKLSIGDFAPYFVQQPRLEGLLSGNVVISDIFGKPAVAFDTRADEFRLDGDSIGTINEKGTYLSATGIAKFNVDANDKNFQFTADGGFNAKDSTNNQMNISFITQKFDLGLLNNYLGSVFTDIKGNVNTSDLKITGNVKHLLLTGTATLFNGSFRVNYTQCKYDFNNETILFNPDEIDLGTIQLKDSLKNTATVSGKLYHNFFTNFEFDNVLFETNRLLVLNTTRKDNDQFYGKVIGQATMLLNGPVNNMTMDIDGEPSRRDSSHIYLLSDNSVETSAIDYIDFKQFGTKMEKDNGGSQSSNILVNMNLTANPSCKIDVILDETTGDVIKGEGNGKLNIRVGSIEPLTIRGRYDITRGNYTFNFQTFLKKPFTLTKGSIVWTGDPYLADIDVTAEYLATNVDFSDISPTTQFKSNVRVIAHLTEKLNKPKISFEFQLPETSENDYVITKILDEYKNDENEMNKQVTSLLLFNSFISNNSSQGFLNADAGYSVLSSTIGGVVSGVVSDLFNKVIQKYIKNTSFYFNSNSSVGSTTLATSDVAQNVAKLQAAVTSGLVFTLVNGRLIISAGINLDYNDPYASLFYNNTNVFVTPDFTAEWLLTKDGRVRVVGFNKTSFDITGQRNRSGVRLTYHKDFDIFSELLAPNEEKRKNKDSKKTKEVIDSAG